MLILFKNDGKITISIKVKEVSIHNMVQRIKEEFQPIFDKFYQSHKSKCKTLSSGLGLAIL
jgi:signal transduction histidine kinase